MKAHPEKVDRAILGGVESIDHGWDSPQGIWNVYERLDERVVQYAKAQGKDLPEKPVTSAIKAIVSRLRSKSINTTATKPNQSEPEDVEISVFRFQRVLREGILARRETRGSLENFPKFVMEVANEDYEYLATKCLPRPRVSGPMQGILIDSSPGISDARLKRLDAEPAKQWVGDLNLVYRGTRELSPTPVVPDAFRSLKTDIPVLMIHGDLDQLTPIENAEEQLKDFTNAHLIRVGGGTHGAIHEAVRNDRSFLDHMVRFLEEDLSNGKKVAALKFPQQYALMWPPPQPLRV